MEYLGDRRDLKSQDEEIDRVKFFSKYELMRIMDLEETCEFLNEVW
jgi:putative (di)nucleoside polyphosphate hydrolase